MDWRAISLDFKLRALVSLFLDLFTGITNCQKAISSWCPMIMKSFHLGSNKKVLESNDETSLPSLHFTGLFTRTVFSSQWLGKRGHYFLRFKTNL